MMYAQDKQHVPDRVELKGILSEFRDALEEEIDIMRRCSYDLKHNLQQRQGQL